MSDKPVSLSDKVSRLRNMFVEQLPERLADARKSYEALRADHNNREMATSLHRNLHSIHGTGASFGFLEISALAKSGEKLITAIMEDAAAATPENWRQLADSLVAMEKMIETPLLQAGTNREQSAVAASQNAAPVLKPASERLVYICDEEPTQAEQLGKQLFCFGYRVSIYTEAASLQQAILAHTPDVVVMDVMFPLGTGDGANLLTELRVNHGMRIPAVFISDRCDFNARLLAIRAGGEAFFSKPVDSMEFVSCLDLLTRQDEAEAFKVLVVDDEPEIGQYHSLILEDVGMLTRVVHEPEKVLDVVSEFKPDLVLMDMYMPDCSGREVAKLIRQVPEFVSLPIVFLSSETDKKKQFSAMDVGAEGFLTKPIQPEDLVVAVALRAERMRTLRSLMTRDSLTGLINHTTTTQFLESSIATARRLNTALSFAMIDMDHFKSVNDTYGHPIGDQVLLALARVLRQRVRQSDLVGRYGGEEFALILNGTVLPEAARIMEQLRKDFSKIEFHAGNVGFYCTFSCGVASFPGVDSMEELREAADKALYKAKRSGRNQVVAFGDEYE